MRHPLCYDGGKEAGAHRTSRKFFSKVRTNWSVISGKRTRATLCNHRISAMLRAAGGKERNEREIHILDRRFRKAVEVHPDGARVHPGEARVGGRARCQADPTLRGGRAVPDCDPHGSHRPGTESARVEASRHGSGDRGDGLRPAGRHPDPADGRTGGTAPDDLGPVRRPRPAASVGEGRQNLSRCGPVRASIYARRYTLYLDNCIRTRKTTRNKQLR